jgi:hypothetical protein
MSTYSLKLLSVPGNHAQGTLPHGPRAYIAVKGSSTVTLHDETGESHSTVLTPECVSLSEFRTHVKRLIKELETIDSQAEKFFEKHKI